MTLSDLASIGTLVSALAVLASLAYFGLQLRQAERNQRASIRTARASRSMDLFMGCTEPLVAEAMLKGMRGADDISDVQIVQFLNYAFARFFNAEDAFYQHQEGHLDAFYLDGVAAGLKASFASPGLRAIYRRQREVYGRDFVAFADQILAATPLTRDFYWSAHFRDDVAAELAPDPGSPA